MFKILDKYIIKKYLGTFFLSIVLIISVSIVFDLAEKLDNFYSSHAPFKEIVLHYYMNFIPFFANLLTPLFVFISVIFFTSKMAYNTEIIAMLSTGMSFKRLLVPYFVSAALIGLMSFMLGGYIIPYSNSVRLDFQDKYIKKFKSEMSTNIQLELEPGMIAYIERYEKSQNRGYHFSLEKFNGKTLMSRLTAQYLIMDSLNHWHVSNYRLREFNGMYEKLTEGERLDTVINMNPADFFISAEEAPQMTITELRYYLKRQKERGIGGAKAFENEYNQRFAMPFASLILTLIGVSLSSRKVRGGTGLHLGLGLMMSALYVLFSTVSSTFAVNGSLPSIIAVWLPNLIFGSIGVYLYFKAPK
ncbi:MAG: LptF/LptG family permease [Tannerella sp.]|jgi:lipopolysaccharide export system permease protein|nr:LptF/LptG family permease [Tannerella sp.]